MWLKPDITLADENSHCDWQAGAAQICGLMRRLLQLSHLAAQNQRGHPISPATARAPAGALKSITHATQAGASWKQPPVFHPAPPACTECAALTAPRSQWQAPSIQCPVAIHDCLYLIAGFIDWPGMHMSRLLQIHCLLKACHNRKSEPCLV